MGWPKIKIKVPSWDETVIAAQQVGEVIEVVATVAAILLAAPEDEEPMDPYVKGFHLYEQASTVLENMAAFDPEKERPPFLSSDQVTKSGTLLGCWFNPTTDLAEAINNKRLYNDLATFLTLSGVPAKIEIRKKGHYEDTPSLFAGCVFEEPGPPGHPNVKPPLVFSDISGNCTIEARRACYKLPLGNEKAETTAWHAAVEVRTTMTKKFHQAQLHKLPKNGIVPAPTGEDDWMFLATIRVDFATSSTAEEAGQDIPDRVRKNPGYEVTMTSVIGSSLTLKVAGPKKDKPAAIEAKFCKAVADFVKKDGSDVAVMPNIKVLRNALI